MGRPNQKNIEGAIKYCKRVEEKELFYIKEELEDVVTTLSKYLKVPKENVVNMLLTKKMQNSDDPIISKAQAETYVYISNKIRNNKPIKNEQRYFLNAVARGIIAKKEEEKNNAINVTKESKKEGD